MLKLNFSQYVKNTQAADNTGVREGMGGGGINKSQVHCDNGIWKHVTLYDN